MLGDTISQALEAIGITEQGVSKWLGVPCHCPERKEKLNRLHRWASRVVAGKLDQALVYLNQLIESDLTE